MVPSCWLESQEAPRGGYAIGRSLRNRAGRGIQAQNPTDTWLGGVHPPPADLGPAPWPRRFRCWPQEVTVFGRGCFSEGRKGQDCFPLFQQPVSPLASIQGPQASLCSET